MTGPRIAIVDDHALVRAGLARTVHDELDAQVVYEGTNPAEVLALEPLPNVCLLDLDLGYASADPVVAGRIQAAGCPVLVVSAMAIPEAIQGMIDVGVSGFISKREPSQTLVKAIRYILADGTWTSPEVAALLVSSQARPHLSPAQQRVLTLYASGMTLDSVARRMGISPGTASTHLKRARAKYSEVGRPTSSRIDLYKAALTDGILDT